MDRAAVQSYFNDNSQAWIADAYEGDGYTYPTALARVRAVLSLLTTRWAAGEGRAVVDLGCGGGHLCVQLAEKGFEVTGVDASDAMVAEAEQARAALPPSVQSRVTFVKRQVLENGLAPGSADVVTAMGLIGYLPDDAGLFREAARLVRPGGLFLVSCRNRLFNMISISESTLREIHQGTAKALVEEIQRWLQSVPTDDALRFLSAIAEASRALSAETARMGSPTRAIPARTFTRSIEARQHTPEQVLAVAKAHRFQGEGFCGIHPHLLVPNANRLLPPGFFNRLSGSLDTLAHLPISLVWSSVFLGVFRKS